MLWVVDFFLTLFSVAKALIIFLKNKKVEDTCTHVQLLGELRLKKHFQELTELDNFCFPDFFSLFPASSILTRLSF